MLIVKRMPDITNDERGRRIFQLHKEKAVETALDKIRHGLKSELAGFSPQDMQTLTYILGEAWVSVERHTWEQCSFTKLARKDLELIINIGNRLKNKKIREETALDEICSILKCSI